MTFAPRTSGTTERTEAERQTSNKMNWRFSESPLKCYRHGHIISWRKAYDPGAVFQLDVPLQVFNI
jgi:hypothetical protein